MFGGIRVGRLAGIPFFVNPSWFFVFTFVTYSLATGSLPEWIPGEASWVYWSLGPALALLFFGSLVAHELGHSLASRAYGIPVRSITLHLFGGVAQLGREVRRPWEEFWIAVAGPAVSLVLGGLFLGAGYLLGESTPTLASALVLLGVLNLSVLVFNLVPGFPLDGGRVLRAVVWGLSGNYRRATKVASAAGRGVGLLLIVAGIFLAVSQGDLSSLWLALVGFFLISIARQSYSQAVIQDTLQKTPVSEAQIRLIAVPGYLSLDELYAGYVSTTGWQYYLVQTGDRPSGVLTPYSLANVPRALWHVTPLTAVMRPLDELPEINLASSAVNALHQMEESRADLLRTVENNLTVGVVTRDRLLRLMMKARAAG
jgi:Zn-dependent protease